MIKYGIFFLLIFLSIEINCQTIEPAIIIRVNELQSKLESVYFENDTEEVVCDHGFFQDFFLGANFQKRWNCNLVLLECLKYGMS